MDACVLCLVEFSAQIGKAFGYLATDVSVVLADTAREYDDIHAVHGSSVCTDIFLHAVDKHLSCEVSTVVALFDGSVNVARVARYAAHAHQTRFLIDKVVELCGRQVFLIHNISSCTEVEVAGTRTHHQSLYGGQSHRGIHRFSVEYSSARAAVADVCRHNLLALCFYAEVFAHASRHIAMACSVEAVAADSVFLVELVRQGIHVGVFRHGLVECGVEYCYLRYAGQRLLDGLNTFQVSRVVQRCQFGALHNHLLYLRCDKYRFVELLSAVHHAVSDSVYLLQVFDAAEFLIHQCVQNQLNTNGMFGHSLFDFHFLSVGQLHLQERVGQSDFLHAALCHYGLVVHVEQLVLDTAATAV